ncbi:primosomal protein N', partial [bacterium]|nr:primosomal protein N' [bacterium]
QISNRPPLQYEAKYILDIIDDEPVVDRSQLTFWTWMSGYYLCSLGQLMAAALPAGLKMEGESKILLNPAFNASRADLDPIEHEILLILEQHVEMQISKLAAITKRKGIHKYLKSLYLKEAIYMKEDLESNYKPKTETFISISSDYQSDKELSALFDELEKRAPKQVEVLMRMISGSSPGSWHLQKDLHQSGLSKSAIKGLIAKDILISEEREVSRLQYEESQNLEFELNQSQKEAKASILSAFEEGKPVLLHGVTSSGKTLIYIDLILEHLAQGEQVLYLLPEIALTSQLLQRLAAYFGDQLLVSHSKFSTGERVEIYNKVKSGEPVVILGTRSAIFQPFQNLGLIVVDEEHENSFKQYDPAPRFNARDSAIYLAAQENAPIILGSATPAIESYYNALQGKYALVEMKGRYNNAPMPVIEIIDMKEQKKQKRIKGVFSDTLLQALEGVKAENKQSILFQNRKGYVPVLECTLCSWTPKCVNCDISLTYYKYQNNLRCHYCGYTREPVSQCAACGNHTLELIGYGTERIEDELQLYLPELKSQRLDYDTTRRKTAHKKIIDRFENQEIDVMIGTQMVSKGLDFDHVNLVAVMNADHLLNFPDFRAHERAYQLITQVAGRAGRRKDPGMVYIQSAKPGHGVLHVIKDGSFEQFFEEEIEERKKFNYPPFTRLIKLTFKHKDALELHKAGAYAQEQFKSQFGPMMLGPEKPFIGKIRNMYLLNFLLKMPNDSKEIRGIKMKLSKSIQDLQSSDAFKGVRITLDVDPL